MELYTVKQKSFAKGPSPSSPVPVCSSAAAQTSCEASTSGWRHSQLITAAGGPGAAGDAAELGQGNSAAIEWDGEQKIGKLGQAAAWVPMRCSYPLPRRCKGS